MLRNHQLSDNGTIRDTCVYSIIASGLLRYRARRAPRQSAESILASVERAAHYLKVGQAPVSSLASVAGYHSHEAFTRAFKSHFGMTPSLFREQKGLSTWARSPLPIHYTPEPQPVEFTPVRNPRDQACVEVIPPLLVAFVRHVGPYEQVGNVFERLLAWAGPKGLLAENALLIGAAHDDPGISGGHVRFDACFLVPEQTAGEGEVGVQTLGGGEYAGVTHRGPFEKLADTYGWLACDFIPRIAREPRRAPALEVYLTDPTVTPPDELLTDVLIPLEPHGEETKS